MGARETGVVLLAMGGPDSLAAVEPFLANLFADPLIFPVPGQRLLAPWLAWYRARSARGYYEALGGASPLIAETERQARALEAALSSTLPVVSAFRYWGPTADDAVARLRSLGCRRAVALPMYPQYCRATTLSSFVDLRRAAQRSGLEVVEVDSFHEDPSYLDALAEQVRRDLARAPAGATVVLSAHGVPVRLERSGDPYVAQVRSTAAALARRLPRGTPSVLAFQSRVGPVRWVGPDTPSVVRSLARTGARDLVVVPLTFVTEHVETLDELDVRLRGVAMDSGVRTFRRVPALGTDPAFVAALGGIVRRRLGVEAPCPG